MRILITGCGRSGTKFTSHLIKNLGLNVKHEKPGKNGTIDWHLAPILKNIHSDFNVILHQVRHPIKVISSMQNTNSWKYIEKFLPQTKNKDIIHRSMIYWFKWNQMVEPYAHFRYQLEEIEEEIVFNEICKLLKVKADKSCITKTKNNPRNFNKRNHSNLNWSVLQKKDAKLTEKIKELAKKYKYKI